jgi:hypothetical protein
LSYFDESSNDEAIDGELFFGVDEASACAIKTNIKCDEDLESQQKQASE